MVLRVMGYDGAVYRAELQERRQSGIVKAIRNLMQTAKWTAAQAMDALLVPKDKRQKYLDRIQTLNIISFFQRREIKNYVEKIELRNFGLKGIFKKTR